MQFIWNLSEIPMAELACFLPPHLPVFLPALYMDTFLIKRRSNTEIPAWGDVVFGSSPFVGD